MRQQVLTRSGVEWGMVGGDNAFGARVCSRKKKGRERAAQCVRRGKFTW